MKIDFTTIKKILIIQFKPYGDVLLTTSYLEALRNKFPDAKIDFLVSEPFDKILYRNPFLDEIIILRKDISKIQSFWNRLKMFSNIKNRNYDLIIDQQNTNLSVQTLLFSRARYKLGWIDGKGKFLYNIKAKRGTQRYNAAQKFDLLAPLRINEIPFKLYYYILPKSYDYVNKWFLENNLGNNKLICFSPGSPVPEKIWDKEFYAKVADKILVEANYKVAFLWAPNELSDVKYIINKMKLKALLAPPTNFNQCAAFLKRVSLLVCNDGGINHLSVATETPALVIFGKTSPLVWSPYRYAPNHFHICNPKYIYNGNQGFGIMPQEVFNKIQKIMKKL